MGRIFYFIFILGIWVYFLGCIALRFQLIIFCWSWDFQTGILHGETGIFPHICSYFLYFWLFGFFGVLRFEFWFYKLPFNFSSPDMLKSYNTWCFIVILKVCMSLHFCYLKQQLFYFISCILGRFFAFDCFLRYPLKS